MLTCLTEAGMVCPQAHKKSKRPKHDKLDRTEPQRYSPLADPAAPLASPAVAHVARALNGDRTTDPAASDAPSPNSKQEEHILKWAAKQSQGLPPLPTDPMPASLQAPAAHEDGASMPPGFGSPAGVQMSAKQEKQPTPAETDVSALPPGFGSPAVQIPAPLPSIHPDLEAALAELPSTPKLPTCAVSPFAELEAELPPLPPEPAASILVENLSLPEDALEESLTAMLKDAAPPTPDYPPLPPPPPSRPQSAMPSPLHPPSLPVSSPPDDNLGVKAAADRSGDIRAAGSAGYLEFSGGIPIEFQLPPSPRAAPEEAAGAPPAAGVAANLDQLHAELNLLLSASSSFQNSHVGPPVLPSMASMPSISFPGPLPGLMPMGRQVTTAGEPSSASASTAQPLLPNLWGLPSESMLDTQLSSSNAGVSTQLVDSAHPSLVVHEHPGTSGQLGSGTAAGGAAASQPPPTSDMPTSGQGAVLAADDGVAMAAWQAAQSSPTAGLQYVAAGSSLDAANAGQSVANLGISKGMPEPQAMISSPPLPPGPLLPVDVEPVPAALHTSAETAGFGEGAPDTGSGLPPPPPLLPGPPSRPASGMSGALPPFC